MTIINGASHHNVEDILASIRTSIAGEGSMTRPLNGEIQTPSGRREQMVADEAADFELPAIFKPGHQQVPERQRLLGRLSEALKNTNPADSSRPRTVIPFDPSGMRPAEPQAAPQAMMYPGSGRNGPRPQPQQASEQRPEVWPEPQPEFRPESRDVKRIMPTFFDTRISKLGEMSRQASQPQPEPPKPQRPAPEPPAVPRQRLQPMLPEGNLALHGSSVDDAAAQLLRPMLRQWLQENMPKIVEKALLSEAQATDTPPERT